MAQVHVRQAAPVRPSAPRRGPLVAVPLLLAVVAVVAALAWTVTGTAPGVPGVGGAPAAAASPAPALSADPARIDFPDVPTGRRGDPVTVTVTNVGTSDAHLGMLSVSGQDAGDVVITASGCWQETLPPGVHCTVQLAFTPTQPGRRSAVLGIAGAAGEEGVTVTLQGTGVGPAPAPARSPAAGTAQPAPSAAGTSVPGPRRHTVTWLGTQSRTVEATSALGAAVPYEVSPTVDGIATAASCDPLAGTFALGTTRVTCTVETGEGTVSTSFDVTVRDTTGPRFTLPSSVVVGSDTYAYTPVVALDTVDGAVAATCTPRSPVGLKPLLPQQITCQAKDRAGNVTRASWTVVYVFRLPTIVVNPPSPTASAR